MGTRIRKHLQQTVVFNGQEAGEERSKIGLSEAIAVIQRQGQTELGEDLAVDTATRNWADEERYASTCASVEVRLDRREFGLYCIQGNGSPESVQQLVSHTLSATSPPV